MWNILKHSAEIKQFFILKKIYILQTDHEYSARPEKSPVLTSNAGKQYYRFAFFQFNFIYKFSEPVAHTRHVRRLPAKQLEQKIGEIMERFVEAAEDSNRGRQLLGEVL